MSATADMPRVVRQSSGRVRLHAPGWTGHGVAAVEAGLGALPGVRRVRASAATRNVLLEFDDGSCELAVLVAAVERETRAASRHAPPGEDPPLACEPRREEPPVLLERGERLSRARIGVQGLAGDPELGGRLMAAFARLGGVRRVSLSQLTGRVLVEFDEHQVAVSDLVAQVTRTELPDLPEDDRPAHPLDRAPLIQSGMRAAGALTGLGLIAARRIAGADGPPVASRGPLAVCAVIGVLEGLPPLRRVLRTSLGR